jgi:hypothetical protein
MSNRTHRAIRTLTTTCVSLALAAPALAQAKPKVVSGAGDVLALVEEYRKLLGGKNNANDAGTQPSGRREINWDGVPDKLAAPTFLPGDQFKARGAILRTPGNGVQVSARNGNPAGILPRFGHINKSYVDIFKPFSGERLFSPVGSNVVDLTFVVPGSNRPAVTTGFGAVYVDTDKPHTAFEYFDAAGKSLGRFEVPVQNNGFSFLGVVFEQPVVARVRIEYGNTALGPDDGPNADVSVMDDFIFGEPQAIAGGAAGKARR